MSDQEQSARAYCQSIGANPDELITRWYGYGGGGGFFRQVTRWQCYVGAVIQHRYAAE